MSREQQLRNAEENDQRAVRIRARFGMRENRRADDVRDWLYGAGAVPAAILAACLVIYLAVSLIAGFTNS